MGETDSAALAESCVCCFGLRSSRALIDTAPFLSSPLQVAYLFFSERITFYLDRAVLKGTGTTAYAWFIWDKDAPSRTEMRWLAPR